nr:hypothetical protein [Tanacetum cinerariifolium]
MDQDSAHMVAASKVPMLKPGVETIMPPTTVEEKAQKRLKMKDRSTLMMGISIEHQFKFNSIKDAKSLLEAVKKIFGALATSALVLYDGLGGYDWSDQAEEGPTNFALMAYSSTSSNSEEDIKILKRKIHLREVAVAEIRRKLKLAQKQKNEIQLTVENFKNSSKNLSKLLDCQILDKCKIGLGYNGVPPPYTRNIMPQKPDLSGLEEFVNEPKVSELAVKKIVVEPSEVKASVDKPKVVR